MNNPPVSAPHPVLQLLLLVGLGLAGLCLASLLALGLIVGGLGLSVEQFGQLSNASGAVPHGWVALMLVQGLSMAGLGAGAAVLPRLLRQRWAAYFNPRPLGAAWWPAAAGGLIIVLVPALSVVASWNAGARFPAWAAGFELWARAKEDELIVLTKFLTNFPDLLHLLVALLVVAVVPAVAEELVFRGVVQRNLVRWTGSRTVGVWLAAAIFSAVHFQFFGFVPRLLLGLLLGYLYEWSGNILLPMAAHFTNNALQLVLLYVVQHRAVPAVLNPDSAAPLPWPAVIVSAALGAGLLLGLRRQLRPAAPAAAPPRPAGSTFAPL